MGLAYWTFFAGCALAQAAGRYAEVGEGNFEVMMEVGPLFMGGLRFLIIIWGFLSWWLLVFAGHSAFGWLGAVLLGVLSGFVGRVVCRILWGINPLGPTFFGLILMGAGAVMLLVKGH